MTSFFGSKKIVEPNNHRYDSMILNRMEMYPSPEDIERRRRILHVSLVYKPQIEYNMPEGNLLEILRLSAKNESRNEIVYSDGNLYEFEEPNPVNDFMLWTLYTFLTIQANDILEQKDHDTKLENCAGISDAKVNTDVHNNLMKAYCLSNKAAACLFLWICMSRYPHFNYTRLRTIEALWLKNKEVSDESKYFLIHITSKLYENPTYVDGSSY
jgi:hypothetical protein